MKSPRLDLLSDLPDDVISDIVSRYVASTILTNKQAIQLGLLSKAISCDVQKRPALMFDDSELKSKPQKRYHDEHNYFCDTLRRYHDENIHLETFSYKFKAHIIGSEFHNKCFDLATKKNLKRLNLIRLDDENCAFSYHVPMCVHRVKSLEQLSLKGWHLRSHEEKSWPNLKRLCLDSVKMYSDFLESTLKRSCPLIESLEILRCCSNKTDFYFRVPNLRNLKQLTIRLIYATQTLQVIATPNFESIDCSYDQKPLKDCRGNFVGTMSYKFPKNTNYWTFRSLSLDWCVGKDILNGRNKFKFLQELSISNDPSLESIDLCCPQLEKIRLVNVPSLKEVVFDVPKVVLFEFEYEEDLTLAEKTRFTFSGNPKGWIFRITLRSRWRRPIVCGPIECGAKWHWP